MKIITNGIAVKLNLPEIATNNKGIKPTIVKVAPKIYKTCLPSQPQNPIIKPIII